MSFRVVCFSGPDGTHMREIAARVAEGLGFTLVDEAIITRAAGEAGVDPHVVADVERRQTFMARLLDALSSSSHTTSHAFSGGVSVYSPADVPMSEDLRGLIRAAIEETSSRGDVVIVSHAASHALAANKEALRVLITASRETRTARIIESHSVSEADATRSVDEADAARADYLKRFYGIKQELPTQYDIVLNTDRLGIDEAVAVVAGAAGRGS
jgi:cytidylate kinase